MILLLEPGAFCVNKEQIEGIGFSNPFDERRSAKAQSHQPMSRQRPNQYSAPTCNSRTKELQQHADGSAERNRATAPTGAILTLKTSESQDYTVPHIHIHLALAGRRDRVRFRLRPRQETSLDPLLDSISSLPWKCLLFGLKSKR